MSDSMKVTALKSMLPEKIEDHIEFMGFKKYDKVEKEVMRLANKSRLKSDKRKGFAMMDTSAADKEENKLNDEEYSHEEWVEWATYAIGKGGKDGKGKGTYVPRPFYGTCIGCGTYGHPVSRCPEQGKGFKGDCKGCGKGGHSIRDCPIK